MGPPGCGSTGRIEQCGGDRGENTVGMEDGGGKIPNDGNGCQDTYCEKPVMGEGSGWELKRARQVRQGDSRSDGKVRWGLLQACAVLNRQIVLILLAFLSRVVNAGVFVANSPAASF
jgi:hypothetical protein